MVTKDHRQISLRRQCELLNFSRSKVFYQGAQESEENLNYMRLMDQMYLDQPTYGYRRMTAVLRRMGHKVNDKRIHRLMKLMGLEAIYPKPRTGIPFAGHKKYPYLLRNRKPSGPNQVWSMDITYIPMKLGFMYLMAVMDWWSRLVISWDLSNTMEAELCAKTADMGLRSSPQAPLIFNVDQGSQFTSCVFVETVESHAVAVSMDGRGRALDNVFIERLWRSLKYEDIYIRDYEDPFCLRAGVERWFKHYNRNRPHQALGYATPWEYHFGPDKFGAKIPKWSSDKELKT